jgi:hypothetical protein
MTAFILALKRGHGHLPPDSRDEEQAPPEEPQSGAPLRPQVETK